MAREYTLMPDKKLKRDDEEIPMHRNVGDKIEFYYDSVVRVGYVVDLNPTVIQSGGVLYREYPDGIRPAGFAKEDPNYIIESNEGEDTMSKPIAIADLGDFEDKETIKCVEGRLISLYDPEYKDKNGNELKYARQNGIIKDDTGEHRIEFFGDEALVDTKKYKGKLVRISSTRTSKGWSGVSMDRYNPKYPRIHVTQSAEVEILTAGGEVNPEDRRRSERRGDDGGNENKGRSSYESPKARDVKKEEPSAQDDFDRPDDPTVEDRVNNWFRIYDVVIKSAEARGLSKESAISITTTINLSFKNGYEHRAPVFRSKGNAQSTEVVESEERIPRWQDQPSPSGNKTLGELSDGKLINLIKWAYATKNPQTPKGVKLKAWLMMAASEKRLSARKICIDHVFVDHGYGDKFDDDAINNVLEHRFGKDVLAMEEEDWIEFLVEEKNIIDEIKLNYKENIEIDEDELPE